MASSCKRIFTNYPNPIVVMVWFMQLHCFFDMESRTRLELNVGFSSSPSMMNELGLLPQYVHKVGTIVFGIDRAVACDISLSPSCNARPNIRYPDILLICDTSVGVDIGI